MSDRYLKLNRLEEVVMLIQLFGLGDFGRSSDVLTRQLGGPPKSRSKPDDTWVDLVKEHPEFFVSTGGNEGGGMLRLAIRYVRPDPHPPIDPPLLELLIKTAVDLHESAVRRAEREGEAETRKSEAEASRAERKAILTAALIAGFSAIIANFIAAVIHPK